LATRYTGGTGTGYGGATGSANVSHHPTGALVGYGGGSCAAGLTLHAAGALVGYGGGSCSISSEAVGVPGGGIVWSTLSPAATPTACQGYLLVYDQKNNQLVRFGGEVYPYTLYAETWVYDFATANWSQKTPAHSPSARSGCAGFWDATNEVVVLFGGRDGNWTNANDLWTWDGTDWTQQIADGAGGNPSTRSYTVLASHSSLDYAILYGGWCGNDPPSPPYEVDETWRLDCDGGYAWTEQSAPSAPGVRYDHAMVYHQEYGEFILAGGQSQAAGWLDDTWVLTPGGTWTQIGSDGGFGEYPRAVYDSTSGMLLLSKNGDNEGIWQLDRTHGIWSLRTPTGTPPIRRERPGLAPGPTSRTWYFHGGGSAIGHKNDLYKLQDFEQPYTPTTVEEDLNDPHGPQKVLLFTIDGEETVFAQVDADCDLSTFTLGGSSRPVKKCLRCPTDDLAAGSLNVRDCTVEPNGLNVELEDFEDTDGKLFFAKRFAPGRWADSSTKQTYIEERTAANWYTYQVDADAATIVCDDTADMPASGTAYVGQETISYLSKSGGTPGSLNGVTRGKWPPFGTRSDWGATYRRPLAEESLPAISTQPFSFVNRRCALHVTAIDPVTGLAKSDAKLLYVGRLSAGISYDPISVCWRLSTFSLLEDLDAPICTQMGKTHLRAINLQGAYGRKFYVFEQYWGGVGSWRHGWITVPTGEYLTPAALATAIHAQINNPSNWSVVGTPNPQLTFEVNGSVITALNWYDDEFTLWILPYETTTFPGGQSPHMEKPCHALAALGLTPDPDRMLSFPNGFEYRLSPRQDAVPTEMVLTGEPYEAYHPLDLSFNGQVIYVDDASELVQDQGDNDVYPDNRPIAHLLTDGSRPDGGEPHAEWLITYREITTSPRHSLTLFNPQLEQNYWTASLAHGFIGQKEGEDEIELKQRYVPTWRKLQSGYGFVESQSRGPFVMLLPSLLSTGTVWYNSSAAYDLLPLEYCGPRLQSELVDIESFYRADEYVTEQFPNLVRRWPYIIEPDTPWSELLQRECQTFGYALAWDIGKGQLSLKPLWRDYDANEEDSMVGLGAIDYDDGISTDCSDTYTPTLKISTRHVVNRWEIEAGRDPLTGEAAYEVVIKDSNSMNGLVEERTAKIEHPGIWCGTATEANIQGWLVAALTGQTRKALAWGTVDELLAPHWFQRASVGDRINYSRRELPDIFGLGVIGIGAEALVVDRRSNLDTFTGQVTLLLFAPQPLPGGGSG